MMPVPYSPLAIANRFIGKFGAKNGIEHMKLQKLVYCSYGWWLAAHGLHHERLTNEGPEIWKHGPVFDSLYQVLKVFGRSPITVPQSDNPFEAADVIDDGDEEASSLVNWIWGRYGHLSSYALSDMTHKTGTAWQRVAAERDYRVPYHTPIPDSYIFDEFAGLMRKTMPGVNVAQEQSNRGRAVSGARSQPYTG